MLKYSYFSENEISHKNRKKINFFGFFERPSLKKNNNKKKAIVKIVGAGPGNPALLTIAAYNEIKNAKIVVTDKLVSQEIISLIPPKSKIFVANKKGRAQKGQKEIFNTIFQELEKGNNVLRLKAGDPTIYSRISEEILEFTQKGWEVDVFPGLSSLTTAPLSSGFPLTSRNISDKIIVATAHGSNNRYTHLPEYIPNSTYVFFMSISRIEILTKHLIEKKYPDNLSIIIVENATNKKQRIIKSTIKELNKTAQDNNIISPALIIIGKITDTTDLPYYSFYNHENGSTSFISL